MKKFVLAAVVATVFGSAALAAPPPPFSWTGFYVGANVGYGNGHLNIFEDCQDCAPNPIFPMGNFNPAGAVGGVQAGYNYQMSNYLLGVVADIDYTDVKVGQQGDNNGYIHTVNYHWLASARGRAGVIYGSTMFFATGGAAFANIHHSSLNPQGSDATTTKTGWVVGGGAELALENGWTLIGEYLHFSFGETVVHGDFTPVRPIFFHYEKETVDVLRIGMNYKVSPR